MRVSVLVVLVACLAVSQAMKKGNKKGGHRHSGKVWHLARNETECGKVQAALIHSNTTAEACSQAGIVICLCTSKDQKEWNFKCGECQLEWNPIKDDAEESGEEAGGSRSKAKKQRSERAERRRQIRNKQKTKAMEALRKEKAEHKRKQEERLHKEEEEERMSQASSSSTVEKAPRGVEEPAADDKVKQQQQQQPSSADPQPEPAPALKADKMQAAESQAN